MKPGFLAAFFTVAGLAAVVFAFMTNASPYVTVAQAKRMKADNLHVAGDLVPGSLIVQAASQRVSFTIKDLEGQTLPVVYRGAPPANMGSATKVVVIGGYENGVFACDRMLLKCPSKYESEPATGSKGA